MEVKKFVGYSLSSEYIIEFDELEDIAEHIESNLIMIVDMEESHGNNEIVDECNVSLEVLEDYKSEIGKAADDETIENLNNFADLIQYEYEVA